MFKVKHIHFISSPSVLLISALLFAVMWQLSERLVLKYIQFSLFLQTLKKVENYLSREAHGTSDKIHSTALFSKGYSIPTI